MTASAAALPLLACDGFAFGAVLFCGLLEVDDGRMFSSGDGIKGRVSGSQCLGSLLPSLSGNGVCVLQPVSVLLDKIPFADNVVCQPRCVVVDDGGGAFCDGSRGCDLCGRRESPVKDLAHALHTLHAHSGGCIGSKLGVPCLFGSLLGGQDGSLLGPCGRSLLGENSSNVCPVPQLRRRCLIRRRGWRRRRQVRPSQDGCRLCRVSRVARRKARLFHRLPIHVRPDSSFFPQL